MSAARRGSLLVVTLWVVTLLSALAVATARHLTLDVRIARYRLARAEAHALAQGAVAVAAHLLGADSSAEDWSGDSWAPPLGWAPDPGSVVTVTVTDERGRLNLNEASLETLTALTGRPELAQAIEDYRDAPDPAEDQPAAAPPYFAKNAAVEALHELWDVPGMEPEVMAQLLAQTTVHTESGAPLNLNSVAAEVLTALGVSADGIERIRAFREGPDGPEAHEQDGVFTATDFLQQLTDLGVSPEDRNLVSGMVTSSDTFRVTAEARLAKPAARARIEAVVRRGADEPPRLLAWMVD